MNQFVTGVIIGGFTGFILGGMVLVNTIFILEKKKINKKIIKYIQRYAKL